MSFREVKFLSSEAEARSKITFASCKDIGDLTKTCQFEFRLVNSDIGGILKFFKESFVDASAIFTPEDFDAVRAIFVERYGAPTVATEDMLTSKGKSVSIELVRSVQSAPTDFRSTASLVTEGVYGPREDAALVRHIKFGRIAQESWMRMQNIAAKEYTSSNMGEDRKHDYEREKDRLDHEYELAKATENKRYEKESSELSAERKSFQSANHSGFSITLNEYAVKVEKEKSDTRKKGAGAL